MEKQAKEINLRLKQGNLQVTAFNTSSFPHSTQPWASGFPYEGKVFPILDQLDLWNRSKLYALLKSIAPKKLGDHIFFHLCDIQEYSDHLKHAFFQIYEEQSQMLFHFKYTQFQQT